MDTEGTPSSSSRSGLCSLSPSSLGIRHVRGEALERVPAPAPT